MYMDTDSRIQKLTNNSKIEISRNKGHAKISEFTVKPLYSKRYMIFAGNKLCVSQPGMCKGHCSLRGVRISSYSNTGSTIM